MCGIAGLVLSPPGPIKPEWVETFSQRLERRGPDDLGWLLFDRGRLRRGRENRAHLFGEVFLFHRRLSILDLSESGWQPMGTQDGRYWIVFNGEIYNYLELREELEELGHRFHSRSDTEVLIAAFAQWGPACLLRFVGMFAFAILDTAARRLFLARDCFGIKPLYYASWQDGFAFCSEIPALLELPGVGRAVNPGRLFEYLRSGLTDHGGDTLFAQVKQVPSAHYMEISLDDPASARAVRYWDVDPQSRAELSFEEAARTLRDLFVESVKLHLRSDVPVGAALSGGVDSSSIVAVMRLLDPALEIQTFSYIASDPSISEERWAETVGRAARLRVHKVHVQADDLQSDLDHVISAHGEPFSSTSMYAQWRVFQAAREAGIKVMLDGQGADELLGGYAGYRIARIGALVREGRWRRAVELWRSACTVPGGSFRNVTPRVLSYLVPTGLRDPLRQLLRKDVVPPWINAAWLRERGVDGGSAGHIGAKDALKRMLYETLTESSLPHLLRFEDRNSMVFSIESRVPFLTPKLAQFLMALPEDYIIAQDGSTKAVFRRAMRGIVPDAILDRRDKIGFPTPERQWLLGTRGWVDRVLKRPSARTIGVLNVSALQHEWNLIARGASRFDARVWRWVNLILWAERFSVKAA